MHPQGALLRSFRLQRLKLSKVSPSSLVSPSTWTSSSPDFNSSSESSTSASPSSSSGTSTLSSSSPLSSTSSTRIERPYSITRTDGGSLPVYSEVRNGGGWKTIIRKVDGDVLTLQTHLIDHFQSIKVDPLKQIPKVSVKPTNRHLVVRGKYVDEIKAYLEDRGF